MTRLILTALLFGISSPALGSTEDPPAAPPPAAGAVDVEPASTGGAAHMNNQFSAFGLLSYWYAESGLGVGARYQKSLVPAGVLRLPTVHDDIGLEGGVDYAHYSFFGYSYNEVAVVVGAVWNFWLLDDRLALYPKIDMGYRFGSWAGTSLGGYGGIVLQGAAGIAYRLSPVTLRAEAGSGTLRLGAGFVF